MSEPDRPKLLSLEAYKRSLESGEVDPLAGIMKSIPDCQAKIVGDIAAREVDIAYSASGIDRDGDTVKQKGIDLKNFRKNPVVLYAHGHGFSTDTQMPIGRSSKLYRSEEQSRSVDSFVDADMPIVGPLAEATFRMLTHPKRFLRAASMGFRPKSWEKVDEEAEPDRVRQFWFPLDFTAVEKLEHSIVPIPSQPDALTDAKSSGIDIAPIKDWAERVLDNGATLFLPREHVERAYQIANGNAKTFYLNLTNPSLPEAEALPDPKRVNGGVPESKNKTLAPADAPWVKPSSYALGWHEPGNGSSLPVDEAAAEDVASYFAFAEMLPVKQFEQLRFPHHRPGDGATVLRGLQSAFAEMLAGDEVDGTVEAHEHLSEHYRAFGLEPPLRIKWNEQELAAKFKSDLAAACSKNGEVNDMNIDELAAKLAEKIAMPEVKAPAAPEPTIGLDEIKQLTEALTNLTKMFSLVLDDEKSAQPAAPAADGDFTIELAEEKAAPENDVGKFIAEEMNKAMAEAMREATGKLAN